MPERQIVLRNCGIINPKKINTYLKRDGFKALKKVVNSLSEEQVVTEVKASGLRGRGGAGFPTGLKWELARKSHGIEKYIICNADEGEVGTFKDRYILERDPFTLIEAITIAGHTIGARKGFIYLRAEYRYLLDLLKDAVNQTRENGFLVNFDIEIREGAGAYICGEESALMESIEGSRGEARFRPPFPPSKGLFEKPTVINNVETLMNIPQIVLKGASWFNQIGTGQSKGTKVFSVSGDVVKPGVYELIMGSSLRELVEDIAQAQSVRMIQIGGATGRIISNKMLDTPIDFENVLGAGAITVFNKRRDIIDVMLCNAEFLSEESCGKCTPCREGTEIMVEILKRFCRKEGTKRDIDNLKELSSTMMLSSLCGLGQAAPTPIMDSLYHFKKVYDNRMQKN